MLCLGACTSCTSTSEPGVTGGALWLCSVMLQGSRVTRWLRVSRPCEGRRFSAERDRHGNGRASWGSDECVIVPCKCGTPLLVLPRMHSQSIPPHRFAAPSGDSRHDSRGMSRSQDTQTLSSRSDCRLSRISLCPSCGVRPRMRSAECGAVACRVYVYGIGNGRSITHRP